MDPPKRPIFIPRDWSLHVWKAEEFRFLGPKTMTNLKHQLEEYQVSLLRDMRLEFDQAKSHLLEFVATERENFARRFSPPSSTYSTNGSGFPHPQ